jgi:C-terminal processing protease CtpA/Prc
VQRRLPELIALAAALAACAPRTGSIGAVLGHSRDEGRLFVRGAPPDRAAARAGLQVGDEVVAIDGRDVRAMSPEEVHAALEGPIGTDVRLTVLRRGSVVRLAVTRAPLAR